MKRTILHITTAQAWQQAQAIGEYRAESLDAEGFIHCSTPAQVCEVGYRYYRGQRGLILLAINPEHLRAPLMYEGPQDLSYGYYPHIYGAINLDAVVGVLPFEPDGSGHFALPDQIP
jgi:uncharacterized protein (DUF952 family)